jgi:threonine dehydratase
VASTRLAGPVELGPTLNEIYQARQRIRGVAHRTPLERSSWLSELAGCDVYLKLESWQRTRSFKIRGAYNAIASLAPEQKARGLVTASAGNHGQAVALAAQLIGARATIFVPGNAPEMKKRRIRAAGAVLDTDCDDYDDAERAAAEYASRTGACFVHSFSDRAVVAGQGTIGLEILEDLPHVHNVIVPVGGGGLIAGIGSAIKAASPAIRVIGVQSTETRAMYDAFEAGRPVPCPITPTLADGLAGQVDEVSYARARTVVDQMVLVEEAAIPDAIRALYGDGVTAEGSAAVGVAALARRTVTIDGPAAVVVTGGNIDAQRFAAILEGE